MAMKVSVSFKESEKDMYEYLNSQLSPSIYIKQLVKNEMEKKGTAERKHTNLLDF